MKDQEYIRVENTKVQVFPENKINDPVIKLYTLLLQFSREEDRQRKSMISNAKLWIYIIATILGVIALIVRLYWCVFVVLGCYLVAYAVLTNIQAKENKTEKLIKKIMLERYEAIEKSKGANNNEPDNDQENGQ